MVTWFAAIGRRPCPLSKDIEKHILPDLPTPSDPMTAMLYGEFWLTAGGTGDAEVDEEDEDEDEEEEEGKFSSLGEMVGEAGEVGETGEVGVTTTSCREDL